MKSDGSIWFSDPDFGITSDYEGYRAESEIGANDVYSIDSDNGDVRPFADCFAAPNGLVFSADERQLFVSDTRAGCIRVFDVRQRHALRRRGLRRRRMPHERRFPSRDLPDQTAGAFGPVEVLPSVACSGAFRSTVVASELDPVLYRSALTVIWFQTGLDVPSAKNPDLELRSIH